MSRKQKIFLIVAVVFLLLVLIFAFLFGRKKPESAPAPAGETPQAQTPLPPLQIPDNIEPSPDGPVEENPKIIASIFTERYGSYSTQSGDAHIRDLEGQMTEAMLSRARREFAETAFDGSKYTGITTNAIRTEEVSRDSDSASYRVFTQRLRSSEDDPTEKISAQSALVALQKSGLKWLVNDFEWE